MTGKSPPHFKYVIVCDDIREEKSNKTLIVGMYASKIIVPRVPAVLPKLCFRLCFDTTRSNLNTFNLLIRKPSGIKVGPFAVNPPSHVDVPEGYINISIIPFPIEEIGAYDVIAETGGKEEKIYRFFVETTGSPSAEPAPQKH